MKKFLIGLALVVGIMILAFRIAYPSFFWNQKVTVTVNTPNGEVSAHAVGQVKVSEKVGFGIVEASGVSRSFKGEAVAVELPDQKYLFALINDAAHFNYKVFSDELGLNKKPGQKPGWQKQAQITIRLQEPKAFTSEFIPLLVTFDDINDPTSVQEVDPANLAATFGPGYSLQSITLEITDEPVTEGEVEKVLGWIANHKLRLRPPSLRLGAGLHPASTVLAVERLTKSDFIRN